MLTHSICEHRIFYTNSTLVITNGHKGVNKMNMFLEIPFLHHISYNTYKTYRLHFSCKRCTLRSPLEDKKLSKKEKKKREKIINIKNAHRDVLFSIIS